MKNLIIVLALCAGFSYASAQEVYTSSGKPGYQKHMKKKKKGYDPDKLIIAGSFNFGFGDGFVSAGISPMLGYRLTDRLSAGVGLGYQFFQQPEYANPVNPNQVTYARENLVYPSIWGRYFIYRNFFADASVEYDLINLRQPGYDSYGNYGIQKMNVTNVSLILGAGMRVPISGRLSGYGELIYDVLQGQYSPYPKGAPDIRVGFGLGI